MRKKNPEDKYRCTSYTYPPQLEPTIKKLLADHQLSGTVSRLLAKVYGVDLEKT